MSFGFSVGDFLAAIGLVHELAVALSDSHGSSSRFKGLVQELYSIERAMIEINNLQIPVVLESNLLMVQRVASQCQLAVTDFLQRNHVYMRCLGQAKSKQGFQLKAAFRKINWAVSKTDDVEELRTYLRGHSMAMGIMLQALQIQYAKETMAIQAQSQATVHQSLMQQITRATSEITANQMQNNAALHSTAIQTLQTSTQTYQLILQAQAQIPSQVLRQQPVYLEDARGVLTAFSLEFVTSPEILIYALKHRYSESGARKVERGRFAITDANTNRDVCLDREWSRCFRPGQSVNMSLFFDEPVSGTTTCPSCRVECHGTQDSENTCSNCGMIFRRIEVLEQPSRGGQIPNNSSRAAQQATHGSNEDPDDGGPLSDDGESGDSDDEISEYKRVRLLNHGRAAEPRGSGRTAKTIFNEADTVAESHEFDFDDVVLDSKAYRRTMAMARAVIKQHASTTTAPQTEPLQTTAQLEGENRDLEKGLAALGRDKKTLEQEKDALQRDLDGLVQERDVLLEDVDALEKANQAWQNHFELLVASLTEPEKVLVDMTRDLVQNQALLEGLSGPLGL